MPPSRRKGGPNSNNNNHTNNNNNSDSNHNYNKVNSVTELKLGDLVLAKVKGFPAWPAKVSRPEDWERIPDPKKYFVQFFGTQEIAFVAPVDIQAFNSESQSKLLAKCKGKTVKYFAQAVKDICEAFEELQKHGHIERTNKHASNVNGAKINGSHAETTKVLKSGESYPSNCEFERASLLRITATGDKQTGAMKGPSAHRHEKNETKKKSSSSPSNLVQALSAAPSLMSPNKEGPNLSESRHDSACRERFESCTTSSSSPHSGDSDVKRNSGHQNAGTKDISISLGASVHLQFSAGEDKKSQFSGISKDLKVGGKRKVEDALCHAHGALSGGHFGDGTLGKGSTGGHAKRLASDSNKFEANSQGKSSKNLLKCPKLSDVKSSPHNLVTKPERHVDGRHQRQRNGQAGSEHSLSVKKAKHVDSTSEATKGLVLNNGKVVVKAEKLDEEAVPVVVKRRANACDAGSNYGKRSLGSSSKNDVPKKRRAVRLCDDDDDDEPKTPVHGGSMKSGVVSISSVSVSDTVKNNENNESSNCARQNLKAVNPDEGGSEKDSNPSVKSVEESSLPLNVDSPIKPNVPCSRGSEALDKRAVEESEPDLVSPITSPRVVVAGKKSVEKPNKRVTKVTNSVSRSKAHVVLGKDPTFASVGSNTSQSQVSAQKTKQPSSGVRSRIPLKTGLKLTEPPASLDNHKEHDSEFNGRLEDIKDRPGSLVDSKAPETRNSIKDLIAQAKRRQAHKQSSPGGGDSMMAPVANPLRRSRSPSPTTQAGGDDLTQLEVEGVETRGSLASPSVRAPQLGSEESEERGLGLGNQSAGSTLSGGTEAAVARDAFEGMIETLSRTKESIGRATRLAIDCAKYGIANQVVDLLIRKLENESSFHRRVDLFFLVDSITQCSHGQKGVAGASYLPIVQASLPRLLGAAAPPGPNARENRRQCLKVLRLWLERKILPESVLRRFMADIGSSNDDTSSGVPPKRPSKVQRSVDDPIRGMEDMLVDEYGSNATFNLPGFLTAHGFVDDEEDEDDVPSTRQDQPEASPPEPCTSASVEPESGGVTPNDRSHHILEAVDGELEMEDATGYPKDGALSPSDFSKKGGQEMQLDTEMDTPTNDIVYSPTLDGSPPPPLDSPPPLPPLPSSPPPPPPPPPLSPLPMPPPPPPSTVFSQPPLRSLLPSGPPQIGNSQSFIPLQPSLTPQGMLHPPAAIPSVQGGNAVQMTGNISQQGPHFVSPGSSISRPLEYRIPDMYPGPQAGPSNQQFQQHQHFQPSQATFVQRAFTPISLPKPPLGPFAYNQPPVQQHLSHPHSLPSFSHPPSHPYPASNIEGSRRFSDEQWRPSPVEYKAENHHSTWVNGGRVQSCTPTAFNGEAYVRPPERAAVDNFGHHASAPNSGLGGPSSSGHGINQMLPSRPETASFNSWRPA